MGGAVLFLDDDADLRDTVVELLQGLFGIRCLALGSYRALVEAGQLALETDRAILDINLGPDQPSGIDAYAWLRSHGYPGKVTFLTGHGRDHPLVAQAHRLGEVAVEEKPVDAEALRAMAAGTGAP